MVLLAKTKLNNIEAFNLKALIDSNVSHDEFVSVDNVHEYDDRKEKIKNSNNKYICLT